MKYLAVILILLFLNVAYAEIYTSTIKIVGVDKDGRGITGNLTVEIQPGKGRILVDTTPLQGLYTQDSERTALKVATDITKFDFSKFDAIYSINTPGATNVEGPSAGAAMTIATIAAIQNKTISQSFSITGTIEADHSIGKVGEIFSKAKAAADSGVSVFLIPKGQAEQIQYVRKVRTPSPGWRIETIEPVKINIIKYARENWGMNIYEVSTIEEALKYAFEDVKQNQNKINLTIPEISLSFKSPVEKYNQFDYFAKSTLSRAQTNYNKASMKLKTTSLPDDVKYNLDNLLKQSKGMLNEGNELLKQGYKYSAGNNGFKSGIYSQTIIDIANYYSTSEANRKIFIENKINEAKAELEKTKMYVEQKAMNSICSKNDMEWAVLALQRLNYAENRLDKISFDDVGSAFFDINVAKEWMIISQEFAAKLSGGDNQNCNIVFEPEARKVLDEAENKINFLKTLGKDTIGAESYLDAAKLEYSKGQYIVALFDASIAKSRADAAEKFDGKDIESIYQEFNKTIFTPNNLISTIFYEHAIYTLHNSIKTGSYYDAADSIQIFYSSVETEKIYNFVNNRISGKQNFDPKQIIIIFLVAALIASLIYISILKAKLNKGKIKRRIKRKKR